MSASCHHVVCSQCDLNSTRYPILHRWYPICKPRPNLRSSRYFFANRHQCPTNYVTYNITAPVLGYAGCNTTYVDSTCSSGIDGSALCNLCGSCYSATPCSSTTDCQTTYGAGYACVSGSACATAGTPVCLYMMAGSTSYGCRGADSGSFGVPA